MDDKNGWEDLSEAQKKTVIKFSEGYIDFLQENKEFDTKFYDVGDGLSVSVRHSDDKNE